MRDFSHGDVFCPAQTRRMRGPQLVDTPLDRSGPPDGAGADHKDCAVRRLEKLPGTVEDEVADLANAFRGAEGVGRVFDQKGSRGVADRPRLLTV